jgi:putative hydrolase of the HAD superfamily
LRRSAGKNIELVLVDFDDTIVHTAPRFSGARRQLFELLGASGYTAEEAERLHHEEIDPAMRAQYGFGPQRLEHAFRETYERLRDLAGHAPDDGIAERCAALGRAVAGTPPAFDGAIAALQRLAAVHPTVLYTQSGDPSYQMECVRGAGVLDILAADRVRIAASKGADDFVLALERYGVDDPARVWMVGNSMRSDVNPALEAGANAILVETPDPWHYDMVEPVSDAFVAVPTFVAAVDFLLS